MKQEQVSSMGIVTLAIVTTAICYITKKDFSTLRRDIVDQKKAWENQVRWDKLVEKTLLTNGMWRITYSNVPGAINLDIIPAPTK